jgi:hypothetical protein
VRSQPRAAERYADSSGRPHAAPSRTNLRAWRRPITHVTWAATSPCRTKLSPNVTDFRQMGQWPISRPSSEMVLELIGPHHHVRFLAEQTVWGKGVPRHVVRAVTAPASTPEGSTFTVHVTGSADEPELAWTAFVHVDVTATPPSGGPVHATRVVRVT